jgi:hypothetical protein
LGDLRATPPICLLKEIELDVTRRIRAERLAIQ